MVDAGEMHLRFDRDKLSGGQLPPSSTHISSLVLPSSWMVPAMPERVSCAVNAAGVDLVVDLYAPGSLAGAFKGIGEDAANPIADKADAAVEVRIPDRRYFALLRSGSGNRACP